MHVAIIMHGNGQWATQRGLPSAQGSPAGVAALRTTVALAAAAGIRTLTLYANCGPGGARPGLETDADLRVLTHFLRDDRSLRIEDPLRISLIGTSARLRWLVPRSREHHEQPGTAARRMHLRIVVDYSAHDLLTRAALGSDQTQASDQFFHQLSEIDPTALPAGAVDLLVRTGAGRCQGDFMLWELAYAKLHFVDHLWPDFTACDFLHALNTHSRQNALFPTH
jgi:undecaprenyl diphosphate synthase